MCCSTSCKYPSCLSLTVSDNNCDIECLLRRSSDRGVLCNMISQATEHYLSQCDQYVLKYSQ